MIPNPLVLIFLSFWNPYWRSTGSAIAIACQPTTFIFFKSREDFKKQVIGLDFSMLTIKCCHFRSKPGPMNVNENEFHHVVSVPNLAKKLRIGIQIYLYSL